MHYSRSKASTRNSGNAPKLERVLAGKIAYLGMIRGLEDNTYLAFSKNLLGLLEQLRNERQDIVWRIWKTEGIEAAIIYKQAL